MNMYLLRSRNENIANKINSGENITLIFYCNYICQYEVYIIGYNKIKLKIKFDKADDRLAETDKGKQDGGPPKK